MRRFLSRVYWARIGCVLLGSTSLALTLALSACQAEAEVLREDVRFLRDATFICPEPHAVVREGLPFDREPAQPPLPPPIDAIVLAVKTDTDPQLVLLSAGTDDGVERGLHFSVYRGSQFVGKVVVEKVLRDSAGCRVLFTAEGQAVRSGDQAATRLQ